MTLAVGSSLSPFEWAMRVVVQRVKNAAVKVAGETVGSIGHGMLVFAGIGKSDNENDVQYIVSKLSGLRIFEDPQGKMNLSVKDVGGGILVVSQFTLYGDCRQGRRPSFDDAAVPEQAHLLYESLVKGLREGGLEVAQGRFQEKMSVELVNDGPVTFILDSKRIF